MTVTLYNNSSDPRVLRKSISKIGSDLTVQITDNCSVENPVFRLAISDDKINANYLYVGKWKKYYYITSRDILNGKEVIRFKSISDNNIGTGKPIMLIKPS